MTSAYQMAILTQFNVSDTLSYKDIEAGTKLSPTVLKPQLGLLVKLKILLNTDEEYSLNMGFKSKKIRVNLNQTIKSEARAEQKEVIAAVDEDRKFVYQATIVRLMKGRKVCFLSRPIFANTDGARSDHATSSSYSRSHCSDFLQIYSQNPRD